MNHENASVPGLRIATHAEKTQKHAAPLASGHRFADQHRRQQSGHDRVGVDRDRRHGQAERGQRGIKGKPGQEQKRAAHQGPQRRVRPEADAGCQRQHDHDRDRDKRAREKHLPYRQIGADKFHHGIGKGHGQHRDHDDEDALGGFVGPRALRVCHLPPLCPAGSVKTGCHLPCPQFNVSDIQAPASQTWHVLTIQLRQFGMCG